MVLRAHLQGKPLPHVHNPYRRRAVLRRGRAIQAGYRQHQRRPRPQAQAARQQPYRQRSQHGQPKQRRQMRQRAGGHPTARPHHCVHGVFADGSRHFQVAFKRQQHRQQSQRHQHPRKPRNQQRIGERRGQRHGAEHLPGLPKPQQRSRILGAQRGAPFAGMFGRVQPAAFRRIILRYSLQPPLRHPNQRRHRTEGKPKAHAQSRERVEQQHCRQRLPPSPPRRRTAAPIPLPGKHRQHQQTALNRHAEAGQCRIKQSRCQASRQIPASRLGQRQAQ